MGFKFQGERVFLFYFIVFLKRVHEHQVHRGLKYMMK